MGAAAPVLGRVLVLNAGSSSLKLRLLGASDELVLGADLPSPAQPGVLDDLVERLPAPEQVDVVGHRIVHGGARFDASVVVDDDVAAELGELAGLAPLHSENYPPGARGRRCPW